MRAELKRLHRRLRTTAVYVTHDQEEAMTLGDRVVVMKDGSIQQVGHPLDVYERPENRFVAGFMGMPPMNLIPGTVVTDNGGPCFEGAGLRLALPASAAPGDAVLGLRPEHLSERAPAGPHARLALRVSVVEPLGDRQDVTLTTPTGETVVARIDARTGLREGEDVLLYADLARLHLFDPSGGRRDRLAAPRELAGV
jgi:multiple sugar transport system ATP-binding protein